MPKPKEYKRGDPIKADDLTRLAKAATQRINVVGGTVKRTGTSVSIQVPRKKGGGGGTTTVYAQRYRVKTVSSDSLTCRTWDGATEGSTDVYILMPPDLAQATWAGKTINGVTYASGTGCRTATVGTVVETQYITPAYVPAAGAYNGSEIYAIQIQNSVSANSHTCTLVDLNVDGRAWAWDGN